MWVFSNLMFSQNYRSFLNIFKVNLHLKLKSLGRTFLPFYTELGIVQLKCMECMEFCWYKISYFLTSTAEFLFFRSHKAFHCQKCSSSPTLWISHEMEVRKKQMGTERKQTHAIWNTKVLLLYILRITCACGCTLSLVSLSGWAIYTERTIQARWSSLDENNKALVTWEAGRLACLLPQWQFITRKYLLIMSDNIATGRSRWGNSR